MWERCSETGVVCGWTGLERAQPSAENLAVVETARGRSRYRNPGLHYAAIKDISTVTRRVHPALDDRFRVRIPQRYVLSEAAVGIADVTGAIAQGRELRARNRVRHFLEARHVLSLDLRHSIELLIVDERR